MACNRIGFTCLLACLWLAGPSLAVSPPEDDTDIDEAALAGTTVQDPWQGFNRPVFTFNLMVDRFLLRPADRAYRWALPETVRDSIGNALDNLGEPVNALNGLLQLNAEKTFTPFWRFALNSTFGFAGLCDFAGENASLHYRKNSFGDTLQHYGVGGKPYLVLPLLGPSNPRDAAGLAVDFVTDPFFYYSVSAVDDATIGLSILDERDQNAALLDELYYRSIEPYVAVRSAYQQHQTFVSRSGKTKAIDQ